MLCTGYWILMSRKIAGGLVLMGLTKEKAKLGLVSLIGGFCVLFLYVSGPKIETQLF